MDFHTRVWGFLTLLVAVGSGAAADGPLMRATGVVVDGSGNSAKGMTVDGYCIPAGQPPEALVSLAPVATATDGRFVIGGLPAGTCTIYAEAAWGMTVSAEALVTFVVTKGVNVHDIRLPAPPPPEPAGAVSGRIVGVDGKGLEGYLVNSVCRIGSPAGTTEECSEETGSNGDFTLTDQPAGLCRLRLGRYEGGRLRLLSSSRQSAPCRPEEKDVCIDVTVVPGAAQGGIVLRDRGGR